MRRTSCVYTRQSWFPCVDGQASGGWDWVSPDNPSYLWSLTNTGPASTLQSTDHPSLSLSYNYYGNILALMLLRSLTLRDTAWHCVTLLPRPGPDSNWVESRPAPDWLTDWSRAESWVLAHRPGPSLPTTGWNTQQHFLPAGCSAQHLGENRRKVVGIFSTNWHRKWSSFTSTYPFRQISILNMLDY